MRCSTSAPTLQWQPIETAPKDETEILLWRGRGPFRQASMVVGLWLGGWIDAYDDLSILPAPILWQPLPSPPETTDSQNEERRP